MYFVIKVKQIRLLLHAVNDNNKVKLIVKDVFQQNDFINILHI